MPPCEIVTGMARLANPYCVQVEPSQALKVLEPTQAARVLVPLGELGLSASGPYPMVLSLNLAIYTAGSVVPRLWLWMKPLVLNTL